jgi:hypothetical protein
VVVLVVDVLEELVDDGFVVIVEGVGGTLVVLGIESGIGRTSDVPPHAVASSITLRSDGPTRRDDPTRPTLP